MPQPLVNSARVWWTPSLGHRDSVPGKERVGGVASRSHKPGASGGPGPQAACPGVQARKLEQRHIAMARL